MKPLTPNTMVQNRYLVVQPIGKGGMGEVYLAVDQRLGSAVALKRTFFSDDSALGTAFEREARILARLRHPVLPKVIDHFAENGDQFLVMEHISGDDLSKRLESTNKPFPLSWVMFWADQLLDALGYLHTHEPPIIHRDIKPQNLKLTDENHIVLLDFGLSKDFDTNTAGVDSASVAGYSPHFAAMEQIRGTGTDGRSDLYSLSATLYQLMTGVVPVDALSRADALIGGQPDPIVPLNEINSDVPEAVSNVILKGIALRQDERFTTASEMQRSLRRAYNQGRPQEAQPAAPLAKEEAATPTAAQTPPPAVEAEPNFDATLQMQPDAQPEPPKQSEIKTAVMSSADLTQTEKSEDKKTRTPNAPKAAAAAASVSAPVAGPANAAADSTPRKVTGAEKKSGSRTGVAVAGILGFLLVSAAVGGGGWYAYNNYFAASEPTAAPAASPTPEQPAVAEVVPDQPTNANVESQSDAPSEITDSGSDVNSNSTASPSGKPTPQTKTTPVKVQKTPGSKPTPRPRGDDRTVILQ